MAALMAGVQGSRGPATRLGSRYIQAWAQTWDRKISVTLDRDGSYYIRVLNIRTGATEAEYRGEAE